MLDVHKFMIRVNLQWLLLLIIIYYYYYYYYYYYFYDPF